MYTNYMRFKTQSGAIPNFGRTRKPIILNRKHVFLQQKLRCGNEPETEHEKGTNANLERSQLFTQKPKIMRKVEGLDESQRRPITEIIIAPTNFKEELKLRIVCGAAW